MIVNTIIHNNAKPNSLAKVDKKYSKYNFFYFKGNIVNVNIIDINHPIIII